MPSGIEIVGKTRSRVVNKIGRTEPGDYLNDSTIHTADIRPGQTERRPQFRAGSTVASENVKAFLPEIDGGSRPPGTIGSLYTGFVHGSGEGARSVRGLGRGFRMRDVPSSTVFRTKTVFELRLPIRNFKQKASSETGEGLVGSGSRELPGRIRHRTTRLSLKRSAIFATTLVRPSISSFYANNK